MMKPGNPRRPRWWEQKKPTAWLGAQDVVRVASSKSHPDSIGHGGSVTVYKGVVVFSKGGKTTRQRVAIKWFRRGSDDAYAKRIQELINKLVEAKIPIPKTAMYKIREGDRIVNAKQGEWVMLQQLFYDASKGQTKIIDIVSEIERNREQFQASIKGIPQSKLNSLSSYALMHARSKKARRDTIHGMTLIANLGFSPRDDMFGVLRNPRSGSVPFDFVELPESSNPAKNAYDLFHNILKITKNQNERLELYQLALRAANPELNQELLKFSASPALK